MTSMTRICRRVGLAVAIMTALTALSGCSTASKAETQQKAQYHYQLGTNFFGEKMIPQAIRELLIATEKNPEHPDAHHLLGFIYMGRRDYTRAVQYYRKAIEARPDFYICMNNLGTALMASSRWEEAIEIYEGLINKPMYNTPELAYNNLGWSYFQQGELRRAEETLQMAVFLKPEMCLAYNNLGLVQTKLKNKTASIKNFLQAVKRCPQFAEPYFHLAQALRERGDPKALEYYRRCYELASDSTLGDRCRSYLEVFP